MVLGIMANLGFCSTFFELSIAKIFYFAFDVDNARGVDKMAWHLQVRGTSLGFSSRNI